MTAFSFAAAAMNSLGCIFEQEPLGYALSLASWYYVALLGALRTLLLRVADRRS